MPLQKLRVLVTVKAYPNPSKSHGETVCVAGIDLEKVRWIRLSPIRYRDLDYHKRSKKCSIIAVKGRKAISDKRPESWRVDESSIQVLVDSVSRAEKWKE